MKAKTMKFVGEEYRVDPDAVGLFTSLTKKGRIGRDDLLRLKNEAPDGILTVEMLEGEKPEDTRVDVSEDGTFSCMFAHAGQNEFRTQGWTLMGREDKPINDRTGKPIRLGRFFVISRQRLEGITRNYPELGTLVKNAEALTSAMTGSDASTRLALVVHLCKFHERKAGSLFTKGPDDRLRLTDKASVLIRLEESEAFFAGKGAERAQLGALERAKQDKFRRAAGESKGEMVQWGPVQLFADHPHQREISGAIMAKFPVVEGGVERVAKMSVIELMTAVPDLTDTAAEAIIRKAKKGTESLRSSGATIGERSAAVPPSSDEESESESEDESPRRSKRQGRGSKTLRSRRDGEGREPKTSREIQQAAERAGEL